jgi:hypothetical protein
LPLANPTLFGVLLQLFTWFFSPKSSTLCRAQNRKRSRGIMPPPPFIVIHFVLEIVIYLSIAEHLQG